MKIPQEDDRVPVRKHLLALLACTGVSVAVALLCHATVFEGRDPDRRESGGIYTGLMSVEKDGLRRRERGLERLGSWGAVSSGTVHVPIDRAMELALPRLDAAVVPPVAVVVARPDAVGVEERLGEKVPAGAVFTDTEGRRVTLGGMCDGSRPVLLVLAYEKCPMLCGLVLRGAARAVKELGWKPGERFRAVTVSFDPGESPAAARQKQGTFLSEIGCPDEPDRWPFLAGRDRAVEQLTAAVGFRTYRDPASKDIAHPAVLIVLTPDGRVSRYLYGVEFRAKDLELALLEASEGRAGSAFERVLLRCYRWDATTHRYQLEVLTAMRTFGAIVGVMVLGLVMTLWRRESGRPSLGTAGGSS